MPPTPLGLPLSSLERPTFGIEAGFAQNATPTRTYGCIADAGFELDPEQTTEGSGEAGLAFETQEVLTHEMAKGTAKLTPDYLDTPYVFQSTLGNAVHTNLQASVEQNVWTDMIRGVITPQSLTCELINAPVDNSGNPGTKSMKWMKANGLIFPGFKFESSGGKAIGGSASMLAKALQPSGVNGLTDPSAGQNCVQVITVNGTPASGNFVAQDTDTMVKTAAFSIGGGSAALQTLLRTLGGDYAACTVAGSAGGPWTVTVPSGKFVKLLTIIYTNPDGTSTLVNDGVHLNPSVTAAYTTPGGMKQNTVYLIQPSDIQIGFATSLAALMNTPLLSLAATEHFETKIDIGDRHELESAQNTNDVQPKFVVQKHAKDIKDTIAICTGYDATIESLIDAAQALTNSFVYGRVAFTGPLIGNTGIHRQIICDAACRPRWRKNRDSGGNIKSVDFDLGIKLDKATGFRMRWSSINEIADYSAN